MMEQKQLDTSNPNDFVIPGDPVHSVRLSMDSDFQLETDATASKPIGDGKEATLALDSLLTTTDFLDNKSNDATLYGDVNLIEDEKLDLVDLTASNISLNSYSFSENIDLPSSSDNNPVENIPEIAEKQEKPPIEAGKSSEPIFGQTTSDFASTKLDKTEYSSSNESKISDSFTSFKSSDNTIIETINEHLDSVTKEQLIETKFEKFAEYDKPLDTITEDKTDEEEMNIPAYETQSSTSISKQSLIEEVSTSFNRYSPVTVEKSSVPEAQLAESVMISDASDPTHSSEVTHENLEPQSSKTPFKSPLDETLIFQLAQQPIEPVQVVEPLKQSFEQPLQFTEPSFSEFIDTSSEISSKVQSTNLYEEDLDTAPSAPIVVESLQEMSRLEDNFVPPDFITSHQVSLEDMPVKVPQVICPVKQVYEEDFGTTSALADVQSSLDEKETTHLYEEDLDTSPSAPIVVESLEEMSRLEDNFVPPDFITSHQVSLEDMPVKVAQVTCPVRQVYEEEADSPSAPPALSYTGDTLATSSPSALVSNESIGGYREEVHSTVESSTVAAHPLTTSSSEVVVPPPVASETLSEELEEDRFVKDKGVAREEEQTSEATSPTSGHIAIEESLGASSATNIVTAASSITSSEPKFFSSSEQGAEAMGRKNYNRDNSSDKLQEVSTGPDRLQEWIQTLLGSKAAEILYWRNPKNSGVVFGAGLVILFSLIFFSVISVVAYTLLFTLLGTLSFRIYKNVMQAVQKTDAPGHPFKEYLEVDLVLTQDRAHEIADQLVGNFNCIVTRMRSVLLVEDYVESLKYLFLFWVLTFIGAWFNGMTLVILAYISAFSLPKVYEMNKAQVDQYINLAMSKINEVTEKVPFLKKTSAEKKED